ncbi:MAG: hypothetical protein RR588_11030 [Solibacillus sp.]
MKTFLNSMFATYLLDEEHDVEVAEQADAQVVEQYEQYPAGFFTSL